MNLPSVFRDPEPANPDAIRDFENVLGVRLPEQFRHYLTVSNARHTHHMYYGERIDLYVQNIFRLTSPTANCDLRHELNMDTIPESFRGILIPIGFANSGDRILISLNCGEIFRHSYDDDTFELLDDDFFSFLKRLSTDK